MFLFIVVISVMMAANKILKQFINAAIVFYS